jgi:hypothetical protein
MKNETFSYLIHIIKALHVFVYWSEAKAQTKTWME